MAPDSRTLFERSLAVAPGGVHSPVRAFKGVGGTPIFFRAAEGAFLESVEGVQYVDFCMSFGPLLLGHRDPDVRDEVRAMLDTAWTLGACEPYSLELAEWIRARVPWAAKLRFVSSGTEAVMSAVRVARAATGREKILKFDGCYHGHLDSLLVRSGSGLAGEACSDSAGVPPSVARSTLVAPLDDEQALDRILEQHGHEIAVVAIEPLPANYGLLAQRPEFLQHVQSAARRIGALWLLDEVISGFRMGLSGMAGRLGLEPDLACYGKVIGGGFNVAAYAGRADLMDLVAPAGKVYQAGTLSANPVGMRAGLATLRKAERLEAWSVLAARTRTFCTRLEAGLREQGSSLRVAHADSLFWIHLGSERPIRSIASIPAAHKDAYARLFHALLAQGIYLPPSGYEVGFVSMAHSPELLDDCAGRILKAAREVRA
ncbi:MAG: glutamate-1-semialdehyde 2,1-aminomutase [Planctomycetia bacterium]